MLSGTLVQRAYALLVKSARTCGGDPGALIGDILTSILAPAVHVEDAGDGGPM